VLLRPVESAQYTALSFGKHLEEAGLLPSMGSVAEAHDNTMAKSFVATLKRELVDEVSWPTR
jgi:putative transposase